VDSRLVAVVGVDSRLVAAEDSRRDVAEDIVGVVAVERIVVAAVDTRSSCTDCIPQASPERK